ncbi:MAG: hypothetical protein EA425_17220 [Puniceicoccaceae bacterium]|nr:MAG: hypothetical protein EA425_17220 [Puniceicoccaceae bacterium]
MKILPILSLALLVLFGPSFASEAEDKAGVKEKSSSSWSLITETPEEGFQLAIRLARKGVTETQPNREVLFAGREQYAPDPDSLIATSQVIALYFQTIAQANDHWRDNGYPSRAIEE